MKPLNSQFEPGKTLLAWWKELDDNRAARAALRRASNLTEVTLTPHYQKLYRRLCAVGWDDAGKPYRRDALAAAVGLLAHVEHDDERKLALAMSKAPEGSDRAPVSALRFMRLLESPDLESLFIGLRRVLPLMGQRANVLALSNDVIHWGDSVKKQWAYDYQWPAEKSKN
jgi:CRISPR system Cascade subunit CasB